jgi:hypothetical protein
MTLSSLYRKDRSTFRQFPKVSGRKKKFFLIDLLIVSLKEGEAWKGTVPRASKEREKII